MVNKPLIRPYFLGGVALGGLARIPMIKSPNYEFVAEQPHGCSICTPPVKVTPLHPRSHTLPETNGSPLKIGHPKRKLVFQPSISRCYVSFRECNLYFRNTGLQSVSSLGCQVSLLGCICARVDQLPLFPYNRG